MGNGHLNYDIPLDSLPRADQSTYEDEDSERTGLSSNPASEPLLGSTSTTSSPSRLLPSRSRVVLGRRKFGYALLFLATLVGLMLGARQWAGDPAHLRLLRARQRSQFDLMKEHPNLLQNSREHNMAALARLESCLDGQTQCPERPVILSSYIYIGFLFDGGSHPGGEMVWLEKALEYIQEAGYIIVHNPNWHEFVSISRIWPDLVYQYWMAEDSTLYCQWDPRCVQEYTPLHGGEDLSVDVPASELGMIPLARLMTTSYWGAFPAKWGGPAYMYGFRESDGIWSYNALGQQWTLTPFAYPNNTHLPWTIEHSCLQTPYSPRSTRDQSAVWIYSKWWQHIVEGSNIPPEFWDSPEAKASGFTFQVAAAQGSGSTVEEPAGLIQTGPLDRHEFAVKLGSVQAVVGIGRPTISPTVYVALCQGTPVLIPVSGEPYEGDERDRWSTHRSQHPMVLELGAPYAFPYEFGNTTDLLRQLHAAMEVDIGRYIPPDMREPYVRKHIKEFLEIDFISMAEQRISENGGKIPTMAQSVRDNWPAKQNIKSVKPGPQITWSEDLLIPQEEDLVTSS